jgi:hypothetical protein
LLLEPQRSNLQINSENAGSDWGAVSGVDITANQIASPDGFVNADLIAANSSTINHIFEKPFIATNGTSYSISYFAKANTNNQCFIFGYADNAVFAGQIAVFNLTDGTIVSHTGGGIAKIENYGNGWYRVCLTLTAGATATGFYGIGLAKNGARQWTSDGTSIYMWGVQFETGAYATSYIPTLGTSVTRVAEVTSKTGISSLIGQTEGTMFAEFTYNGVANSGVYEIIMELAADANNVISLNKNNTTAELYVFANVGGVIQVNSVGIAGTNILGTHKVALAYKLNDYVCYLDGVQVFSDTSATVPACSRLSIGTWVGDTQQLGGTINQTLLFQTRLSNSDLAALTA